MTCNMSCKKCESEMKQLTTRPVVRCFECPACHFVVIECVKT
jgi:hypothetical protein